MFSKNIRIVYLYVVCFITLMMAIGGIIATVNAVSRFCFPEVYVSYRYEAEETKETEQRQVENERIRNIRGIINSSIVWFVAVPIFALHWKRIQKEEQESDVSDLTIC